MDKEKIVPEDVGKRIRFIRFDLGLSMTQFAKKIDNKAKSGTISNWETGKNLPNNERIKRIAELGGVSVNYLLYGKNYRFDSNNSKTYYLGSIIRQIRTRLSLSQEEFGKMFDPPADRKTVSSWEKNTSVPNIERLQLIADLEVFDDNPGTDFTINDLIGMEENQKFSKKVDEIFSEIIVQYENPFDNDEIHLEVSRKMAHFASDQGNKNFSKSELKKQIELYTTEVIDDLEKNSKYYPKSNDNAKLYTQDLLVELLKKIDSYYKAGYWSDKDVSHPLSKAHLIVDLDYVQYEEIYQSIQELIERLD